MMKNVAKNLVNLGFKSGDVAGFLASNTSYSSPAIFGCFLLRMPINPIDTSFSVNQIIQIYRETMPKVVFCDHNVVDKLMAALGVLESDATIIILTQKIDGLMHISDLLHDCYVPDE
jgi:long-subunit acyl-CoA synthetase (AMP-forming)